MRNVEIKVFRIAGTMDDREEMRKWLDHIGATDYELPLKLTGSEMVTGHAAKRCYMSFEVGLNPNVTRVRKDWHDYFENVLKSGHGSVLEHATYTYAIEGVSRVFTGELNRHRAGVAISEGSMRYIRFDDIPYWIPNSIRVPEDETSNEADEMGEEYDLRLQTQDIFEDAFFLMQEKYDKLCKLWGIDDPDSKMPFSKKKQLTSLFRRIIPMGVATGGVWTFNLRALRHIIALRTTPHAEEEIAYTLGLIAKDIVEREPNLFCDFEKTSEGWVPKYEKV